MDAAFDYSNAGDTQNKSAKFMKMDDVGSLFRNAETLLPALHLRTLNAYFA
jgi:hypothetical protein